MRPDSEWRCLFGRSIERPSGVGLWTDGQLLAFATKAPIDPAAGGAFVGELLLRRWLYGANCPPDLQQTAATLADPALASLAASEDVVSARTHGSLPSGWGALRRDFPARERAAWEHFTRRVRAFLEADGVFPAVWRAAGEALAVPFRLRDSESTERRCCDVDGIALHGWSSQVGQLERHTGEADLGFTVLAAADETAAKSLAGDSFGLALLLAAARRAHLLWKFPVLSVLSTGTFTADGFARVESLPAKSALARRLGARWFFAPTDLGYDPAGFRGIVAGLSAAEVLDLVRRALEESGLGQPSAMEACARIDELQSDLRLGRETPTSAERILRLCHPALDLPRPSDHLPVSPSRIEQARQQAQGIARAIDNHRGKPQPDLLLGLDDRWTASTANVETVAHAVVNLTDTGRLATAEKLARDLLAKVKEWRYTNEDERTRCDMIAHGLLGGQPLLHAAVAAGSNPDSDLARESLAHLRQAQDLARQLVADERGEERARELCRDAAQVALWHALLHPVSADAEWDAADDILRRQPAAYRGASSKYLLRTRFLAAYRRWRVHGHVEPCAATMDRWELPDVVGDDAWLRATALKYRAALRSVQGRATEAAEDFARGWKLLRSAEGPLLRFIGFTILVQGGECLQTLAPAASDHFLRVAEAGLSPFRTFLPDTPYVGALWLERIERLRRKQPIVEAPDPQLFFVY